MILRRPFAFFIKHFRIIHFILALVTMYLAYNTINMVSFFNEYMQAATSFIDKDVTVKLFPSMIFVFIFISLIVSTIVLILMKWKKKPIIFYLINIFNNLYIWGIYIYSRQIVKSLEINFIDLRTLKLVHDLLVIGLIFQSISIIITVIRSTGFDIKRFNFDDDFNLKIDELDNEEFEFDVNVNTDDFRRNIRKNIRNIKYVYKENKLSIILLALVGLSILSTIIYVNSGVYNKIYKKGDIFRTANFSFGVIDSYISSNDYQGNKISNEKLVIVKIRAKNMTGYNLKLETAKIALTNGSVALYHNPSYQGKFIDLGTVYVNDDIKNDKFKEYLLIFDLPKGFETNKLYLKYFDNADKNVTVSVSPIDLDNNIINKNYNLNDTIKFDDSLIGNTILTINSIDLNNKFRENYKFCITNETCYNSYEYIVPSIADNYNKTLLKITGSFNFDDKLNIKKMNSMSEFLINYGKLKYKINNQERYMDVLFKEVVPKKTVSDNVYLEIYDEVKQADEITLVITIRNKIYNYKLK